MFLICHSPRLFLNFYEAVEFGQVQVCGPSIWIQEVTVFSHLLIFINSSTNILIYLVVVPKFRQSLLQLILCKKQEQEEEEYQTQIQMTEFDPQGVREVEQTKLLIQ